MLTERSRTLLLDCFLALAVGLISWTAVDFLRPDRFDGERWERGHGRYDGPLGPPGAAVDLSWPFYPALLLIVVGVALRRTLPRPALVVIVVGVGGYLAAGGPYGPVLLAPALSLYALATLLPVRRWAALTLLLPPMLAARYASEPYLGLLDPRLYAALVSGLGFMVIPAMLGLLWRDRQESQRLEREQELRRYAYEERLQIARDVHDVVGHSLSVISLQAGVALHVLGKRPEEVESALEAIRRTSREALAELRTTLAVYRSPPGGLLPVSTRGGRDPEPGPLAPPPGLARLDDLVSALGAAGREVHVTANQPTSAPLPATVDQAAYRIIQEALTNVVRHGDGAPATVRLDRSPQRMVVEICDVGAGPAPPLVEGSGILGMRERAQAVGGTLSVSQSGSEFRVRAELPLAVPEPAR